ncbi:MAG: histidinol-phosphatase [Bacteroidales bacterium]|nr:histidinol-phosphatase [Bacteroidales bacterium]
MLYNYHTHCHYCDGKGKPEEFVNEAIRLNFHSFGFSSHAPIPIANNFAVKEEDLPQYVDEIRELERQYPQLPLSCGLECDYIPQITFAFDYFRQNYHIQYIIGGVHLVAYQGQLWFIDGPEQEVYDRGLQQIFHNDIRLAVKTYFYQLFEMIEREHFEILAHFDKIKMHNHNRYFTEDEAWYKNYIFQTLELVQQKGMAVEINTRGIYKKRCPDFYPSAEIIKLLYQRHIPVTVSMDAHAPEEISLGFEPALNCIREAGYREVVGINHGKMHLISL